ncbi:hypothetical protein WK68_14805 [Burkholderia ubonensis]|uniref:hypothetical protein n=1 Tax=Burkholderia ubonensis TaxID=101571 RepID=UPI00075C5ED8|nr:hypothetical protein [Burkholderia ubonensis]KVU38851.1 hypothetical protein WK68_14805 [Burkholderia ubonensis]
MHVLIIIAVLEIISIVVVVALCMAARRADARTERMLSPDEIDAHRRIADAPQRRPLTAFARSVATRWFGRLFRDGSG